MPGGRRISLAVDHMMRADAYNLRARELVATVRQYTFR
jgi:hypothetical protein